MCVCVCGVSYLLPLLTPWLPAEASSGCAEGPSPPFRHLSFTHPFAHPAALVARVPLRLPLTFLSSIQPPSPFALSRLPSLGRPSSSSRLCPSLVPVCLSPLHPHPPQHLSPFLCFPDFVSVSLAFCLLSSFFVSLSLPLSFRLALCVTRASTVAQW